MLITACCLMALLLASLSGCKENKSEITVTTPEWDSLVYPLGMQAYYVSVSSKEQTAQLSLRIDAYKNGAAVQHANGMTISSRELRPTQVSAAVYFDNNENGLSGSIAMALGENAGTVGTSRFKLNAPSMHGASRALFRFDSAAINPNAATPLFAVAYGGNHHAGSAPTPEVLISYYKEQQDATLLVFALESSQTIRELKPVAEQP